MDDNLTKSSAKNENDGNESSDDEFDDLFNFTSPTTAPAGTTATGISGAVPVTSSSPIHFGLDSDSDNDDDDNGGSGGDNSTTGSNSITKQQNSAASSRASVDSSSYQKVSAVSTAFDELDVSKQDLTHQDNNDDDDDDDDMEDIFGASIDRQNEEEEEEDDFQELDEGTREILAFLDSEPEKPTTMNSNIMGDSPKSAKISMEDMDNSDNDNDNDDDDSDDGDLEFVDIDLPSGKEKRMEELPTQNLILGEQEKAKKETQEDEEEIPSVIFEEPEKTIPISEVDEVPPPPPPAQVETPTIAVIPPKSLFQKTDQTMDQMLEEVNSDDVEDFQASSKTINPPKSVTESITNQSEEGTKASIMPTNSTATNEKNNEENSLELFLGSASEDTEVEEINFDNLKEAIQSSHSDMKKHILPFLQDEDSPAIEKEDRPWLWTKAVCGKIMSDVESSSLADAFVNWDKDFSFDNLEENMCVERFGIERDLVERLFMEVECLLDRIVSGKDEENSTEVRRIAKRDLTSVLLFYYQSNSIETKPDQKESDESKGIEDVSLNSEELDDENKSEDTKDEKPSRNVDWHSLIGPIAATLLSASIPTAVASVMLSRIIPVSMPLVSLSSTERFSAAKKLHSQLYFLACYHLPLLVLHLDRHVPGWHWPKYLDLDIKKSEDTTEGQDESESVTKKGRNLEAQGVIPISWFTSILAGECDHDTMELTTGMESHKMLCLWDILLTSSDHSLSFFLALAILEKHSDELLMLRDQPLASELHAIMSFQETSTKVEDFMGGNEVASENASSSDASTFVNEWCNDAKSLRESTPLSVVRSLQKAEDEAVNYALQIRQKEAMEKMKSILEQEAEAERKAFEEEEAKKELEVNRARLERFYKRHCPEKVEKVDAIMKVYEGRLDVLNAKIIRKYGTGFLPNKLLASMGSGIRSKKREYAAKIEERSQTLFGDIQIEEDDNKNQVAISVKAGEILPYVCKSSSKSYGNTEDSLKYYLVDSRPNETAALQGRFPTSVSLSPEDLMDPERMQQQIDTFESLRGAVHICIMGEGFSTFPALYGHNLSEKEKSLLDDDENRTNMCALFFIKRGFPFVSIINGGFAAAHAWLSREYKQTPITSVLVDYDENLSLFAQLESSYKDQKEFANASGRKKTTLVLQKLIDNSMVRLTESENRIEEFTDRLRSGAGRKQVKQSMTNIFKKSENNNVNPEKKDTSDDNDDTEKTVEDEAREGFRLRFHNLRKNAGKNAAKSTAADVAKDTAKDTVRTEQSKEPTIADVYKEGFKNPFSGLRDRGAKVESSDTGDASSKDENKQENKKFGFFSRREEEKKNGEEKEGKSVIDVNSNDTDQQSSTKKFGFLSRREGQKEKKTGTKEVASAENGETKEKNKFGFLSRDKAAAVSTPETRAFDMTKISFGNKKPSTLSPTTDAANADSTKSPAFQFKRPTLFSKKNGKAEDDLDKEIAAALGKPDDAEKPAEPRFRQKFAGFSKTASESVRGAAITTASGVKVAAKTAARTTVAATNRSLKNKPLVSTSKNSQSNSETAQTEEVTFDAKPSDSKPPTSHLNTTESEEEELITFGSFDEESPENIPVRTRPQQTSEESDEEVVTFGSFENKNSFEDIEQV